MKEQKYMAQALLFLLMLVALGIASPALAQSAISLNDPNDCAAFPQPPTLTPVYENPLTAYGAGVAQGQTSSEAVQLGAAAEAQAEQANQQSANETAMANYNNQMALAQVEAAAGCPVTVSPGQPSQ